MGTNWGGQPMDSLDHLQSMATRVGDAAHRIKSIFRDRRQQSYTYRNLVEDRAVREKSLFGDRNWN